jgi:hypothetical protein
MAQWHRPAGIGIQWDQTKRVGPPQQAPLTPEYQALYQANLADQAVGGQGADPTGRCIPPGLPRMMTVVFPMEIVILPKITYILTDYTESRRIYTDGRDWPKDVEATFAGYSIGRWIDEDGDGRYDALEVETRAIRGPRVYDSTGLPLHRDNQTVIQERFFLDPADHDVLRDRITVIDHALTHPWTVTRSYHRGKEAQPDWLEGICAEGNHHVLIGAEHYFVSEEGYLMPTRKDQAPPDLSFFPQPKN